MKHRATGQQQASTSSPSGFRPSLSVFLRGRAEEVKTGFLSHSSSRHSRKGVETKARVRAGLVPVTALRDERGGRPARGFRDLHEHGVLAERSREPLREDFRAPSKPAAGLPYVDQFHEDRVLGDRARLAPALAAEPSARLHERMAVGELLNGPALDGGERGVEPVLADRLAGLPLVRQADRDPNAARRRNAPVPEHESKVPHA